MAVDLDFDAALVRGLLVLFTGKAKVPYLTRGGVCKSVNPVNANINA